MNKEVRQETPGTPGVIAPPPLLLLAALAAGFLLERVAPAGLLDRIPGVVRVVSGGLLIAAAVAINFMGAGQFGKEQTPVNPYHPPARLVTGGIFAVMRNPMYVGFYLLSLGLALIFATDWLVPATAALAVVIHYGVVRREERYLARRFGEAYLRYKERVPRYGWRF